MRLVVFDVDGTLVDSDAIIQASMAAGLADAGLPPLAPTAVSAIVGLSLPVAVATLLPRADVATRGAVVDGYRRSYHAARLAGESPLFPGARDLLDRLAARAGWQPLGGTHLFRLYDTPDARAAQDALARAHVWTRRFPYSDRWLRLGIPGSRDEFARVRDALNP